MKVRAGNGLYDILFPSALIAGGLVMNFTSKDIYGKISGAVMTFLGLGALAYTLYSPRMIIEEAKIEELVDAKVIKYHGKCSSCGDEFDDERKVNRSHRIMVENLEGIVEKFGTQKYMLQPNDTLVTLTDGKYSIWCYMQGKHDLKKGEKIKVNGYLKKLKYSFGNCIRAYEFERVSAAQAVPA